MRIRLIYNHIEHHARYSGYDMMARYTMGRQYKTGLLYRLMRKSLSWKRLEKYPVYHTNWYGGDQMRRELEVCLWSMLPHGTLYHFYYAENDLRIAGQFKYRCNNRVVGSFHQPPEYLETHVDDKSYIRKADAVVVVSEYQVPYMEQFLPRDRIHVVPHGVHVQYWSPSDDVPRAEMPTFVFVGWWLRDLEMAKATIRACAERNVRAQFKIVTAAQNHEHLRDLPNTELMSGIPDDELLRLYRTASALFLPLKMSTANNGILEAMACGTPVISTRTGGIPEYVDETCGILVESGDVDSAVEAIRRLGDDHEHREALGRGGRRRAESHYAWETIGDVMDKAYLGIAGKA